MGSPENGYNPDLEFDEYDLSPEVIERKRPILFVPGWNAKLSEYKAALRRLVLEGKGRVISTVPLGSEEEKVEGLMRFLDLKELEEVDVIAHSLGAMSSLVAAVRDSRIKSLILLNPPGNENDPRVLIRKYKDMLSVEGAKSVADVGGRKIVDMARVVTSFDIGSIREKLSGVGTKVTSIHGVHDILFPPPETAIQMNGETVRGEHNEFVIEGNHLAIDPFIPHALRILGGA